MKRPLSLLALGALAFPLVFSVAARADAPRVLAADEVVWFDDVRRDTLALLNDLIRPDLNEDADLAPVFTAPEPVPSTSAALGFWWPVRDPSQVTSDYGLRADPLHRSDSQFHHGLDIRCATGEPIRASKGGRVVGAGSMAVYGNAVTLAHDYGFTTFYAHMSSIAVRPGEHVRRGTVVGMCGSTGRSTGSHLHFEIRHGAGRYDPRAFIG